MKLKVTLILSIVLVLLSTIVFFSCKKDKDKKDTPPFNPAWYFEFKGTKYEITQGLAFHDAGFGNDSLHLFHIYLTTQGVVYDEAHNKLTGSGDAILFDLVTKTDTSFLGSNYVVHPEHDTLRVNDISNPRILLNGDFFLMSGDLTALKSGSCEVSFANGLYLFLFTFQDQEGNVVSGKYKGEVILSKK